MIIPPAVAALYTRAEVERIIIDVTQRFGHRAFGYLTGDDIAGQAAIYAIEGLAKFDPCKGQCLERFLSSHCRRRLINYRRDTFRRIEDPPCRSCYDGVPHEHGSSCDKFRTWITGQNRKSSLALPGFGLGLLDIKEDAELLAESTGHETDPADDAEVNEMLDIINRTLTSDERRDWLMLRSRVPIRNRCLITRRILSILADHGVSLRDIAPDSLRLGLEPLPCWEHP